MKLKNLVLALGIAVIAFGAQSCEKENHGGMIYPNAVVTVKPVDNESFIMQLDDSTTLKAKNLSKSPFGDKQVRALICINNEDLENIINDRPRPSEIKQYEVTLHYIDSIRTKAMSPDLGNMNIDTYGNSPVDLVNSYETVVEDGYLTLRFRTTWAYGTHYLNLVADSGDPYSLTLYHKNPDEYGQTRGDGLIAFDLSSLPDTQGKVVPLILKWQSYNGPKKIEFKYKTTR